MRGENDTTGLFHRPIPTAAAIRIFCFADTARLPNACIVVRTARDYSPSSRVVVNRSISRASGPGNRPHRQESVPTGSGSTVVRAQDRESLG